jgi:predicted nucleic acid-binding protein
VIRTAIDSSILLDVFTADHRYGPESLRKIDLSWTKGVLVACAVVWAEVRPRFRSSKDLLQATQKLGLSFEDLSMDAALKAGETWKDYRARGGKRDRMIPDFLIAAHAQLQCDCFLTRDRGFYRDYFPQLKILDV